MNKEEARKILKVTKNASRSEIERRYGIYLKRHRIEQVKVAENQDEADDSEVNALDSSAATTDRLHSQEEYSFEQITEAYNVLMGYKVSEQKEVQTKSSVLLKKVGIDEKKAKNFFYYYKYHILVIIALVIAAFFTVRGFINNVKPDFNIAFVGRFSYMEAADNLKGKIKENIPEIKEPGIDGAYLTEDGMGELQYAMETKAVLLFAGGDTDVFILDKYVYERYARQGAFMSLDEIAPGLGVDLEANKDLIVGVVEYDGIAEMEGLSDDSYTGDIGEESTDKHLFGIDISNSAVLKEAGVIGNEMIAAIFGGCEQVEKAEKLLKLLLKE